jgi:chromosome segregation ATPase
MIEACGKRRVRAKLISIVTTAIVAVAIHEASALTTRAMAEADKRAAVEAERNRWMQQVNALNRQLSDVMADRSKVSAAHAESTQTASRATAALNARDAELKTQQAESKRLKDSLDRVTNEKSAATANLAKISTDLNAKATALKTKETEATKLKSDLDKVAKERDSTKASWAAAAKEAADKLAAAQQELSRLTKERDDAAAKAKQEQEKLTGEVTALRSDIAAREAEKSELSAQVKAAEEARRQLEETTTKETEALRNTHEQEVQRLNTEISNWTTQLNQKVDELAKVQQMAEESKKAYAGAEEAYLVEAEILRNEITQLKATLESQLNNLKTLELNSKQREDELQKNANDEKKKLTDVILSYQETEIRLLSELDDLQTKLMVAEAEAQRKDNEHKIAIMRMTSQIKEMVAKANQIKADHEAIIQASREAELRTLEYIDELSTELVEMRMANEALLQSINALKSQYDSAIQERSKIEEQYNSALQAQSKAAAERDSVAAQYNSTIQERSKIAAERDSVAAQYNSIIQERSRLTEERDRLNSRLNGTWAKIEDGLTSEEIGVLFHSKLGTQSATAPVVSTQEPPVDSRRPPQRRGYEEDSWDSPRRRLQQQRYAEDSTPVAQRRGYEEDDWDPLQRRRPQQQRYEDDRRIAASRQPQRWRHDEEDDKPSRQQLRKYDEESDQPLIRRQQRRYDEDTGKSVAEQRLRSDGIDKSKPAPVISKASASAPRPAVAAPVSQKTTTVAQVAAPPAAPVATVSQRQTVAPAPATPVAVPQRAPVLQQSRPEQSRYADIDRQVAARSRSDNTRPASRINSIDNQQDAKLIDQAVNMIVETLMKLTNNDIAKTNAAMNLIGAGAELPSTVESVLSVVAERFNPEVFKAAMSEIENRGTHRTTFVSESLDHLYGANGSKLIYWTKQTPRG